MGIVGVWKGCRGSVWVGKGAVDPGVGVWMWILRQKKHLRVGHGKEAGSVGLYVGMASLV